MYELGLKITKQHEQLFRICIVNLLNYQISIVMYLLKTTQGTIKSKH